MPRSERAARPTRAEDFFAWLRGWQKVDHFDRQGEWQVDRFAPLLSMAAAGGDPIEVVRRRARSAVLAAVFRAEALYARREDAVLHQERASQAKELALAIRGFLADRGGVDARAVGLRDPDYKYLGDPVIEHMGAPASRDKMLYGGLLLCEALDEFAAASATLVRQPPADASDLLGMIFVGNMLHLAEHIFRSPTPTDVRNFALAAWLDMGLPLPDARARRGSVEDWMKKKFEAFQKSAPEKIRAIGFG